MIIKIKPDFGRAKSMFKLALNREISLGFLKTGEFPTIVAEMYYEVIKEICNCILFVKGFKSVGGNNHKDLYDFLFHKNLINQENFSLIDGLRYRRNGSLYYGEKIKQIYLDNKEKELIQLIKKLKRLFTNLIKRVR